ncbi:MAG: PIN domain-containing protein [Candidatus Jordarchaeaceae archaeon]
MRIVSYPPPQKPESFKYQTSTKDPVIMDEKDEIYILDSSALIGGYNPNLTNAQHLIVPEVFEEVIDNRSRIILNLAVSNNLVKVREPTPASIGVASNAAKSTGDDFTLSSVDIHILALALDLKNENKNPILVTDDYSLQNAAKTLGIPFKTVIREGVKQRFYWVKYCVSCKKQYPAIYSEKVCEICGGDIKRRISKKVS